MRLRLAPLTGVALAGLCVINSCLMIIFLRGEEVSEQQPPASVAPSPDLSKSASELSTIKPTRAYTETLAHPVFYKTRAPYVPPPPTPPAGSSTVAPPLPVDPGIAVGGVVLDGVLKKAYLFNKGASIGSWVSEGETYIGWKVESIEPGGVMLRQTGRTLELQLYQPR